MRKQSRRMALCGMMVALSVTVMMMGGVIPLATFCSPAIAGLTLLPVMLECGRKWALSAYVAIAALSLMLSPDKESALLFAFLGYYPVLKVTLDKIRPPLRVIAKLGVFNLAAGAMMLSIAFVFNMQHIVQEYAGMGAAMTAAFVVIANITMLLYDRMLVVMLYLYIKKLRPVLVRK